MWRPWKWHGDIFADRLGEPPGDKTVEHRIQLGDGQTDNYRQHVLCNFPDAINRRAPVRTKSKTAEVQHHQWKQELQRTAH